MTKVAIIQKDIPHYRVRFFEEVFVQASSLGLDVMVYSAAKEFPENAFKFAQRSLPIHQFTRNKTSPFWMTGLRAALKGVDIIVAPQELQCLNVSYLWAIRHRLCSCWIWWGHGYNFQAAVRSSMPTSMKEAVKRFMTRRSDGLITYTAGGADHWRNRGLREDRVIPFYNTIDVESLRKAGADITEQQRMELKHKLGLEGKRVLLFSGRLYADKRVDFLLRAFAIMKKTYPSVALLIIGDGEERSELEQLATRLNLRDAHFLGEIVDPKDTAAYFSLADMMVIPALVGLAIVHGYAFGLPIITTDSPGHGPEIEYLVGDAGVMTQPSEPDVASEIASILSSQDRLAAMKSAALARGDELYLSHSVQRFVNGVRSLAANRLYHETTK